VSALLGSSRFLALSDDALKDEDNAAWVLSLPPDARRAWLPRIHWIRLVDRLAENERFEPDARRFERFLEAFRRLREEGTVDPADPFARELAGIRTAWILPSADAAAPAEPMARRSLVAWDAYLLALRDYHAPALSLLTLQDHDEMLWRLSGRIFQLVPFLTEDIWDSVGELGRLDQLLNNLRDLSEDAENGVCYFPADVLGDFGVSRIDILSGCCVGSPAYRRLMRFWLDDHLPALRARAEGFARAEGIHPSLEVMREHTLRRHARIERVLRAVDLDFRRFPRRYWAEVRRDLAERRPDSRAPRAALPGVTPDRG
jgi:phytoene synthase